AEDGVASRRPDHLPRTVGPREAELPGLGEQQATDLPPRGGEPAAEARGRGEPFAARVAVVPGVGPEHEGPGPEEREDEEGEEPTHHRRLLSVTAPAT